MIQEFEELYAEALQQHNNDVEAESYSTRFYEEYESVEQAVANLYTCATKYWYEVYESIHTNEVLGSDFFSPVAYASASNYILYLVIHSGGNHYYNCCTIDKASYDVFKERYDDNRVFSYSDLLSELNGMQRVLTIDEYFEV